MANLTRNFPSSRAVAGIALVALLFISGLEVLAILSQNDGDFTYVLDDAYIHLAQAEQIARGHYGPNAGEAAAPSSSVLWPLLLVPFLWLRSGEAGPLILNLSAALGTLYLYWKISWLALEPIGTARQHFIHLAIVVLLIPLTNLVGLIFTGMEHVVQLLLTAMIVLGLIHESRDGLVRRWLLLALVLAPLVRYECLALTLPALLYLGLRGHGRTMIAAALFSIGTLAGYSMYLKSLDLGPLPNSVKAKSIVLLGDSTVEAILNNLRLNLASLEGFLLIVSLSLLATSALDQRRSRSERLLAGTLATTIVFHLLFGTMDGFHRYELYAWTAACLGLIYLYRQRMRDLAFGKRAYGPELIIFLMVLTAGRIYGPAIINTPDGANDIYNQQQQMNRFVTDFYHHPVAVVDLGRVAYQNETYVLDLWGLASQEALQARLTLENPEWMNQLAMQHGVQLAMIYDWRFSQLPDNWTPVGYLQLKRPPTSVAGDRVTFYVMNESLVRELRPILATFGQGLPKEAEFVINE